MRDPFAIVLLLLDCVLAGPAAHARIGGRRPSVGLRLGSSFEHEHEHEEEHEHERGVRSATASSLPSAFGLVN